MDRPGDRLNRFIANAGAGMDAAGRPVYTGPGMMYMGPGEFSRTQAVHAGLEADAMRDDPAGNTIRKLLDQLQRRDLPGNVRLPVFPLAGGGNTTLSMQYHNGAPRQS